MRVVSLSLPRLLSKVKHKAKTYFLLRDANKFVTATPHKSIKLLNVRLTGNTSNKKKYPVNLVRPDKQG
jgi:hypothetical protein